MGDTDNELEETKNGIIESIQEDLEDIDDGLKSAEEILSSLENCDYDTIVDKLSPLDRAKYDLTILYSINSYYWMYLKSFGTDAKSHKIMEEMERIKKVKERIKTMTEVPAARKNVVDSAAAHRMVKHELWEPNSKKSKITKFVDEENWDDELTYNSTNEGDTDSNNISQQESGDSNNQQHEPQASSSKG